MAMVSGGFVSKRGFSAIRRTSVGWQLHSFGFIKLKNSEEKIPVKFVSNKYFRVMVDIDDSPTLPYRQSKKAILHNLLGSRCQRAYFDADPATGTRAQFKVFHGCQIWHR